MSAALDDRQRVVKKTFTREQLEGMTVEDLVALVGEAGPNVQLKLKAVVKRADGSIKYDEDSIPGKYGETAEELASPEAVAQTELIAEKGDSND